MKWSPPRRPAVAAGADLQPAGASRAMAGLSGDTLIVRSDPDGRDVVNVQQALLDEQVRAAAVKRIRALLAAS